MDVPVVKRQEYTLVRIASGHAHGLSGMLIWIFRLISPMMAT
jgi:hypothetical protein